MKNRRPTAHLVDYEHDFINKCKEFQLPIKWDECGDPYVSAKGRFRKSVLITPWGTNKFAVIILTDHGRTLNAILNKIEKAIPRDKWDDQTQTLDTEAEVIILDLNNIKKLIKPLSLRKKRVITDDHKAKLMEALSKARKSQ